MQRRPRVGRVPPGTIQTRSAAQFWFEAIPSLKRFIPKTYKKILSLRLFYANEGMQRALLAAVALVHLVVRAGTASGWICTYMLMVSRRGS